MMTSAAAHPTLSVAAILAESAVRVPQRIAVISGAQHISYSQLWRETCAYAGALRDRGIKPGDAVALMVPNIPDFPRVYYAILALGAVAVPVHPLLKAAEVEYVLRDCGALILIAADTCLTEAKPATDALGVALLSVGDTVSPNAFAVEAAMAEPLKWYRPMSPLDPATILYTSGTSGTPKGALLSHLSLVEQAHVALLDSFDITRDDVMCATLPLSHVFGQSNVLNTAFRRGAAVLLFARFDADEVLAAMVRENVTIFAGVPTMFIGLLDAAGRTALRPPLRYAISGGASLNLAVLERVTKEFGITIYEGYGLTETAPTATFNHYGQQTKPGSIETPVWGTDVRIADAQIDDCIVFVADGERGEVVVRGHGLFLRYHGLAQATADAVVDGWFRTGDLGTREESGHITIVDRKKDLIIRGGYNIYPREIEEVLARIPGVRTVAVLGIPDAKHGQEVVAAVVTTGPEAVDESTILAYAKKHIAAHKYPRKIVILDALPLGPSGKVLKRVLVERLTERSDICAPDSPPSPL